MTQLKKKSLLTSTSLSTLSIFVVLIIWQLYSIQVSNPFLMPSPIVVFQDLIVLLSDGHTYYIIFVTLSRLIISVMAASILALFLGILAGIFHQVESFLKPIVVTLRTMPIVSVVVVVLILFGNTFSLYLISFLLLFPIIYQAELEGIKNIPRDLLDVLSLECNKYPVMVVKMVYLPLALPYFKTGMLQSAGVAIKVLVVAEYLSQTQISIGRELYFNRINLEYANVFAWTIILIIIVLVLEYIIQKYINAIQK